MDKHWLFNSMTGHMYDPDGVLVEVGYSGTQEYANKPRAMWREDEGPIPLGDYAIGAAYDHPNLGPVSMPLTPAPDNRMFGRYAFFIHGDNAEMNETASQGCIILSRETRDLIAASDVVQLVVTL